MVTFTSLRASPLAFSGISDFHRWLPPQPRHFLPHFAETFCTTFAAASRYQGSSPLPRLGPQTRTRKTRRFFEQSKDAEEKDAARAREGFCISLRKQWNEKVKTKGINKAQKLSKVFSLSNEMDVCFLLCFPELQWPGCEVVYKGRGQSWVAIQTYELINEYMDIFIYHLHGDTLFTGSFLPSFSSFLHPTSEHGELIILQLI